LNLDEKKEIVSELHEKFKKSKIVIATDYKGMDVASLTNLRRKLRDAGIEYRVVKNTLLTRASDNTDVSVIQDFFKGPTAIALDYQDPAKSAKLLTNFSKESDKLKIKGAVLEGRFLSQNDVVALSKLPAREVLLAHLLATMNSIPASLLRTMNAIPRSLLNVLQAIKDKKDAG
jgi:large subunit ribosomal protein L10